MPVHATAIVDPGARVDPSADIGPFCIIGAEVTIGARTRLMAHVFLEGPTEVGEDNLFYPYSSIGVASQDLKYKGERAETRIGSRNRVREFVTIHRGTAGGGLLTSVGDDIAVDGCLAGHFRHRCLAAQNSHFNAELVTGQHGTAEPGFLNRRQKDKFTVTAGH